MRTPGLSEFPRIICWVTETAVNGKISTSVSHGNAEGWPFRIVSFDKEFLVASDDAWFRGTVPEFVPTRALLIEFDDAGGMHA